MTNLNLKIKDQQPANEENLGSFYMGRMKPSTPPRRVLPRGALTFTTLFAFAAIVWYAYPRGQERYSDIDIPVIAADKAVYKFKPEDPGGMVVLHQDSTVFDPLEKKPADTVEKVRPKPEEPMVKPESAKAAPIDQTPHSLALQEVSHGSEKIIAAPEEKPASVKKDDKKEDVKTSAAPAKPGETPKSDAKTPAVKADAKASAKTTTAKTASAKTAKNEPPPKGEAVPAIESVNSEPLTPPPSAAKPEAKPVTTQTATEKATAAAIAAATAKAGTTSAPAKAAAAKSTPAKPASGAHAPGLYIQFGAYRDEKGAREQWVLLQKKFPDLLKGLNMRTQDVTVPKGQLTRLQATGVAEARAKQICDGLKASKAACILVRE